MLHPSTSFTLLDNEQRLWASPTRTSLSLSTPNKYPGTNPLTISSSNGRVFITNRRIVYLPDLATPQFQSFAAPIQNLHDTHLTAPWFGPNVWVAAVQPVTGGGIDGVTTTIELKLTFRDGGAYDFHGKICEVKERWTQAREVGRADADVHLEQLPAYEESVRPPAAPAREPTTQRVAAESTLAAPTTRAAPPPDEAPPGYDEVQAQTLVAHLERAASDAEDAQRESGMPRGSRE